MTILHISTHTLPHAHTHACSSPEYIYWCLPMNKKRSVCCSWSHCISLIKSDHASLEYWFIFSRLHEPLLIKAGRAVCLLGSRCYTVNDTLLPPMRSLLALRESEHFTCASQMCGCCYMATFSGTNQTVSCVCNAYLCSHQPCRIKVLGNYFALKTCLACRNSDTLFAFIVVPFSFEIDQQLPWKKFWQESRCKHV